MRAFRAAADIFRALFLTIVMVLFSAGMALAMVLPGGSVV